MELNPKEYLDICLTPLSFNTAFKFVPSFFFLEIEEEGKERNLGICGEKTAFSFDCVVHF